MTRREHHGVARLREQLPERPAFASGADHADLQLRCGLRGGGTRSPRDREHRQAAAGDAQEIPPSVVTDAIRRHDPLLRSSVRVSVHDAIPSMSAACTAEGSRGKLARPSLAEGEFAALTSRWREYDTIRLTRGATDERL